VLLDAAQFGSLAHRVRNYWTNLAAPKQLVGSLRWVTRPSARTVFMALPPGRIPQPVQRPPQWPHFPCNQPGQPRAAWPTLMATAGSYAFRPGQPGSVWDSTNPATAHWDEPSATEREFALGYLPGTTAAATLSEDQRRQLLGQCIDANALQGLMALCHAWWAARPDLSAPGPSDGVHSSAAAAQAVPDRGPNSATPTSYSTVQGLMPPPLQPVPPFRLTARTWHGLPVPHCH
jgi:hypothetical protein